MTRKDYIAFAALLKDQREVNDKPHNNAVDLTAVAMCDLFVRDNPRFDRERFLKAAGVQL